MAGAGGRDDCLRVTLNNSEKSCLLMGDEEAVVVEVEVRISNLIIQEIGGDHESSKEKHIRAFRGSVQRKERGNQGKRRLRRRVSANQRKRRDIRGLEAFTANKKKQKSAIMEEEVQALVVDNGSGMCKAGE
jgi:hypothetical protein